MTSSHHAPYVLGYTRTTMGWTEGSEGAIRSGPQKASPSSDCRLQPACMKSESLVIARLHEVGIASNRRSAYCGEYVPGPCTHRPSHHGSRSRPKPGSNLSKAGAVTGVKS